jgi:hypothetical protein
MTAIENAPDGVPPRRRREPSVRGVRVWMDLMAACEQLLLARLQHQAGPGGDLAAAYRAWNRRQMERRDRERRGHGAGHAV